MHPNLFCTFTSFVARPFIDRTNVNHLYRLSVRCTPKGSSEQRSFPRDGNVKTIYFIPQVAIWRDDIANKQKKVCRGQLAAAECCRAILCAQRQLCSSSAPHTIALNKKLKRHSIYALGVSDRLG